MDNVARMEVPNRMRSINVRMIIDNMPIVSTIDYIINLQGVIPVAIWVKTKKSESTLDRELRSSGKAVSLLLICEVAPPLDVTESPVPISELSAPLLGVPPAAPPAPTTTL